MSLAALIYTKFHKGWLRLSEVDRRGYTNTQYADLTRSKKSRLKNILEFPTKKRRNMIHISRISGEEYKSYRYRSDPSEEDLAGL
jgi:hypothetical protein